MRIIFIVIFFSTLSLYSQSLKILFPPDNYISNSEKIFFEWQNVNIDIVVEIDIDTFFSTPTSFILQSNNDSIDILNNQKYYWRAKYYNQINWEVYGVFKNVNIYNLPPLNFLLSGDQGVFSNANKVHMWADLKGNKEYTQSTNSSKPLLKHNELNNHNFLQFSTNGSPPKTLSGDSYSTTDSSYTIIMVYNKIPSNTVLGYVLGGVDNGYYAGGNNLGGIEMGNFNSPYYRYVPGPQEYNWIIVSIDKNDFFKNSVFFSAIGNSTEIVNINFTHIGESANVAGRNFYGNIAEVLIFNQELPDSTRNLVEDYLKWKYTPIPNFGNDTVVCASEYTLKIPLDHGYSNITWSNGQTNVDSITATSTGDYWVVVKSFGLTLTDTIHLELRDKPQLNLSEDTISCVNNGLFLTYTNQGTFEYTWNNMSTSDTLFNLQTGDYFISQNDTANNCIINSDAIHIYIDSFSLQSTLGPDRSFCLGSNLELLTSSTNNEPYIYNWSTGDTTSFIILNTPIDTSINIEVTDAFSCIVFDTIIAQVNNLTAPNVDFLSDTVCFGNLTNFNTLSSSTGTDQIISYLWNFPDNSTSTNSSANYTHNLEQTYNVTHTVLTDSNCENSITKAVYLHKLPLVDLNQEIVCQDIPIQFGQSSFAFYPDSISSYDWYIDNNFIANGQNENLTFNNQSNHSVKLQITTKFGCQNADTIITEVFPPLNPSFSSTNLCFGDSTSFQDQTQSFSIVQRNWTFDGLFNSSLENPKHLFTTLGLHPVTLTVQNAIGCENTISENIIVVAQPQASFAYDKACVNSSSLFYSESVTSDSIISYNWQIDTTIYSIDSVNHLFTEEHNYNVSLQIETENGCKDDTSRSVTVNPLPNPSFTFSPNYGTAPLEVMFENTTEDANLYSWNFGNNIGLSSDENPIYIYPENGIFNISLNAVNEFNCDATIQQQIAIIPSDLDIELKNLDFEIINNNNNTLSIKPNVWLSNVGTRQILNADLILRLDNGTQLAQKWEGNLEIGGIIEYDFDSYFLVSENDVSSYICVEALNVNDNTEINFSNNKTCKVLEGLIQFSKPYPNPANNNVYLDVITKEKGQCQIEIIDILGNQILAKQNIQLLEGYNKLQIETLKYQSGKYFIKMIYLEEDYLHTFVVK